MLDRTSRLLIRMLLRAYPPELRTEFGDDARVAFADRLHGERERGVLALLVLLWRESIDSLRSGMRARRQRADRSQLTPRLPRQERSRTERLTGLMDNVLQDLRYAVRALVKAPGFTATAVAVLAIGIGANAALFSVVNSVLLEPLPFADPERLIALWETNPERGWTRAQVAAANYIDWAERGRVFDGIAAHNDWLNKLTLTGDGEPQVLLATTVTGNFFDVLGVPMLLGAPFADTDTWAGDESKIVLSHDAWQRRFGADPQILGRQLVLNDVPRTVVGVAGPNMAYPYENIEAWVPTAWDLERRTQVSFRRAHGMRGIARLAPGISVQAGVEDLQRIASELEAEYPETNTQMGVGGGSLHEWVVGESRRPLTLLFAAVGLVLLIACANVANMQLVRAADREHELAVRSALGAGRARLLRQRLTESLLLTTLGGVAGIAVGAWVLGLIARARPASGDRLFPRAADAGLDPSVLVFTFAMVTLTGVLFAVLPALVAERRDSARTLTGGSRAAVSRNHGRVSAMLVVAEVALVVPLAVGAGLMVRTLMAMSSTDPGFEPQRLTAIELSFPSSRYPNGPAIPNFLTSLVDTLRDRPEVTAAAFTARLPFVSQRWSSDFRAESWAPDRYGVGIRHDEVTTGAFATMGVPMIAGRDFERSDADGELVAIVNQSFVREFFAGGDVVGERICFDREAEDCRYWFRIVGVADDVVRVSFAEAEEPSVYAYALQDTPGGGHLLIRSDRPTEDVVALARSVLADIDPELPLQAVRPMPDVVAAASARERLFLKMFSLFAGVALLLAALGIYGVVSYSTARRVPEIGVRVTLGASPARIAKSILGSGMTPVLIGAVLGVGAALLSSRLLVSLLFGVAPMDLPTYAVVLTALGTVAVGACLMPVRRATRIDPVEALRVD